MDIGFTGQKVLVTGGSRGIGHGVARAFAEAGAEVSILAQNDKVHEIAEVIAKESGQPVRSWQCDITDSKQVRTVLQEVGTLDVLVANAGLERRTPISDCSTQTEADFRRIIDINVIGTYLVTREAVKRMEAGANIIITSSIWGKTAVADFSAYVASKHANIGFMRTLARELGPKDIRVNCVCPGWVKTDPSMQSLRELAAERGESEAEVLKEISAAQCLPGLQTPEDVASAYLFLASSLAKNITGQTLHVDRGEVFG
ncbi:SDR family NAD(P)-dependent oxidoreductase [Roseibium sp. SCP14]|uniref:SDR family NAD(P)-dependent oxidoreductase n=1 Tax=Roseibium sp. SCP14 TaxID=3141375 RepID=UPI003338B989